MSAFPPATSALVLAAIAVLGLPRETLAQKVDRVAVIAGNNRGVDRPAALRYAERDAKAMREVLVEIGGFAPHDVSLLLGQRPAELRTALTAANRQIEAGHAASSLLLVYYSGHADGQGLELTGERLPFAELRQLVEASPAQTKLLIIDACHSGAITSAKGGRLGPSFDISSSEAAGTSGLAILASSAPLERSHESSALRGSFFTHYLVSGLRGAADMDGDQRITLSEVYGHAYARTVAETGRTVAGTQHPTYDYRLSGRGNVVLTSMEKGTTRIVFGPAISGDLVISSLDDELTLEVRKAQGSTACLSLPHGEYRIALRSRDRVYAAHVSLQTGETEVLEASSLRHDTRLSLAARKGQKAPRTGAISLEYGLQSSALKQLAAIHLALLGVRADLGPTSVFGRLSYGQGDVSEGPLDYRLRLLSAEARLAWRFEHSLLDLFVGVFAGASYGMQHQSGETDHHGMLLSYGVSLGLDFPLAGDLSACVFWDAGGQSFRLDNRLASHFALRGTLGLAYAF
ncbi:MAG: caspase family protein [Myxococcota bacterium]|jgi:hypothetical protein|nr:caspase family protein [Myxococcota bacterium]